MMVRSSTYGNIGYISFAGNESEGNGEVGWVGAVVALVAALVPLVIKWTKGAPSDQWSGWSIPEKVAYVEQSLIVSKKAVIEGQVKSIDEAMQTLIAQVETNESWAEWKAKNPVFIPWMEQAQADVNSSSNNVASLIGGNTVIWVLAISALGYGAYWLYDNNKLKFLPKRT